MRRLATAALLALLALLPSQRSAIADTLLFDYVGFDYESPDPDGSQFGEVGSGYVALGEVPVTFAPLVSDFSTNQYTFLIAGLTSTARTTFGTFVVVDYGPGTLSIYEDDKTLGTLAAYGVNPPNATAPSTFTDGTVFLTGTVQNFRVLFNTANGTGSFEGNFTITGGSQFANFLPGQLPGWTFSGLTSNATSTPAGYQHQVDGQVLVSDPTPARIESWGSLKVRYR
jgi:hypothetical protein